MAVTGFTVGNTAAADKSVAAVAEFAPGDKIIVSIKTDASTPADSTVAAKLTYQDGQKAGDQSAQIKAEDAGTTHIVFTKASPWPAATPWTWS